MFDTKLHQRTSSDFWGVEYTFIAISSRSTPIGMVTPVVVLYMSQIH